MTISAKPKEFGMFIVQVLIAMIGCTHAGGLITLPVAWLLTRGNENIWLDFPYTPFMWGLAAVCGYAINRKLPRSASRWVWTAGVGWLLLWIVQDLQWYDPRWCMGCTRSIWVWYNFFDYRSGMQEGLPQLFVTAPMLNSVAYSIGAHLSTVTRQKKLVASR